MEKFNPKHFIINAVKGFLIGAGAIAPGVSGSSMAVSFGIYQRVILIISNLPRSIMRSIYFLTSLAVGFGGGFLIIALISKVLDDNGWSLPLFFLFGGMMLGTVPKMSQEVLSYKKPYYFILSLLTFAIALTLGVAGVLNAENTNAALENNFFLLFVYGAILGFGVIVPGMSGATILILLGVYKLLMGSVADFDFSILIPVALGMGVTIISLSKVISIVFKKWPRVFAFIVYGFVLGTIPVIFLSELMVSDFSIDREIIKLVIGIVMAIIGLLAIIYLEKYEKKSLDSDSAVN